MAHSFSLFSYNTKDIAKIRETIDTHIQADWLTGEKDLIFQICDELLKNAFKSNYKFLLFWQILRKQFIEANPNISVQEANSWLEKVFYSGESVLLEKQIAKIPDPQAVSKQVFELHKLEREVMHRSKALDVDNGIHLERKFQPLLQIKKMAKELKIHVQFKLESTGSEFLITVSNHAPIREEDVKRIQFMRKRFKEYYTAGRHEYFFIENIDTSGGGHGLGYALMDAILCRMGLDPERSLYLVPAATTMVLLVLPLHLERKHTPGPQ